MNSLGDRDPVSKQKQKPQKKQNINGCNNRLEATELFKWKTNEKSFEHNMESQKYENSHKELDLKVIVATCLVNLIGLWDA